MELKINIKPPFETRELDKLFEFQDDLKDLLKENYLRFKKSVTEHGFIEKISIWNYPIDGKDYILNGHQRKRMLTELRKEGWIIPPLPISEVIAVSYEDAKRKLLSLASQYGTMTEQGLYEYSEKNSISVEDLMSTYNFADINYTKYYEANYGEATEEEEEKKDGKKEEDPDKITYTIVFNDHDEQKKWTSFVSQLKKRYPDLLTLSEKILAFIDEFPVSP